MHPPSLSARCSRTRTTRRTRRSSAAARAHRQQRTGAGRCGGWSRAVLRTPRSSGLPHPQTAALRRPGMPLVITQRTAARLILAAAAVGAGAIHLAFAPEHLVEYRPLGIGFIAAGVLQLLWAV